MGQRLTAVRIAAELGAVVALVLVGSILGAATGVLVLAPILAMALPLVAATGFLHRQGITWRDLGFLKPMAAGRLAGLTLLTVVVAFAVVGYALNPLLEELGAPPMDHSLLADAIEGNTTSYLLFLIPVVWGSAAFGEELLLRGFVLHRFEHLFGAGAAVLLQAGLFALGHLYQGWSGVVNLFAVGVIFGYVYLWAGRNLWPVILAHGLIDTLSITVLYLGVEAPTPAG